MTNRIASLSIVALLAGSGLASAQFQPLVPYPGVPYNTPLQGPFNMSPVFGGTTGFLFSGVLPLGNSFGAQFTPGPNGTMYPSQFYIQPRTGPQRFVPTPAPSYFGGGTMSTNSAAAQPVLDRGRKDAAAPAANADADKRIAQWIADKSKDPNAADPLTALDPTLIHPTEEALVSGLTLNEIAARIVALEDKGKKAKSGLCPPELLQKIVFLGGPAADLSNIFQRATKPNYPAIIADAAGLEALNQAYAPVAAALFAGRRANPADAAKLVQAGAQLRTSLEDFAAKASIPDAGRLLSFFGALESAAKFSATADAAMVLNSKWPSVGANISDLTRHMAKQKMHFGRAAPGDEAIYATLHRAMLGHYATLAQMK